MTATTSSTSSTRSIVVMPVVAELSRSYKYNDHILVEKNDKKTTTRKRPRKDEHENNDSSPSRSSSSLQSQSQSPLLVNNSNTNNCCCCFEVRSCPTKNNQNGMFAIQNIACGDLIIAHEDPFFLSHTTIR